MIMKWGHRRPDEPLMKVLHNVLPENLELWFGEEINTPELNLFPSYQWGNYKGGVGGSCSALVK